MHLRVRRLLAVVAATAVSASLLSQTITAQAMPAQPLSSQPPIIGNTLNGVLRDVPTKYYAAIDSFEGNAVDEVLTNHGLPHTAQQAAAVRGWARDEVRTQEFLDLLAIINKPPADRTGVEQLVHEWFAGVYKQRQIDRAQGGVDQYLAWSGLTLSTINDDPVPDAGNGTGYCNFHPPAALDSGMGLFGGSYDASTYPLCLPNYDIRLCMAGATGCAVPWPSVDQFEAWGAYVADESTLGSPILANLSLEGASGIAIASTAAAAHLAIPLAAKLGAVPVELSRTTGLFAKVFPYSARAVSVAAGGTEAAVKAANAAIRVSAGVIRAVAAASVVAEVITAVVTIVLESITIAEHAKIPVTLLDALAAAKSSTPDLLAVANSDGGAGVLLTTFLSTTAIDVDPSCRLATPDDPYTSFPCANAPAPAAATPGDDRFYVVPAGGTGSFSPTIYTVNPLESGGDVVMPELTRLTDSGWFVTTKYLPEAANLAAPTDAGATLQTMRLYYRGWDGGTWLAERVISDGRPMFVTAPITQENLGGCTRPLPDGSTACLTDVLQYLAPDGSRMTAQVVPQSEAGPVVDVQVPDHVEAGVAVQLHGSANGRFSGTGPFTYAWTIPGVATPYTGSSPVVSFPLAGLQRASLTVTDSVGGRTTHDFVVQSAGHTSVVLSTTDLTAVGYGTSPRLVATVWGSSSEHTFGCADPTNPVWLVPPAPGVIGILASSACPPPTGSVQISIDGQPLGDPTPLTRTGVGKVNGSWTWNSTDSVGSTDITTLPKQWFLPGTTHTLSIRYSGDGAFLGSSVDVPFTMVKGSPQVALVSGPRYPYPGADRPGVLVAQVSAPGGGVPTGQVQFIPNGADGQPLNGSTNVPLNSDGTATFSGSLLLVNSVTVRYLGDDRFLQTDSADYPVTTAYPASNLVDPASSNGAIGVPTTLRVTVLDDVGAPVPGLSLYANPSAFSGNEGFAVTDDNGVATFTVSSGAAGDHQYSFGYFTLFTIIPTLLPTTAKVHWAPPAPPVLAPHGAVTAEVGVPLSVTLSADGVPTPVVGLDTVPAGLHYDADTATLSGTPTAAGPFSLTVTATNIAGTDQGTLSLDVLPAVSVGTSVLPPAEAGTAYSATLEASGGQGPYTWSSSTLPAGLTLDPATGELTGTPATVPAAVTVTVTDALGGSDTADLRLRLPQSVGFAALADLPVGSAPIVPVASASSGLPVSFAADGVCVLTSGALTFPTAGECRVTATQAGDDTWTPATPVTRAFWVTTPLTVRAPNLSVVVGQDPGALTSEITGFVDADGPGVLTEQPVCTTTATLTSVPGDYPVTCTGGAGPAVYTFGDYVAGTLKVSPAATSTTVVLDRARATAVVSVQAPGSGDPTGQVTFTRDGVVIGTADVGPDGTAVLPDPVARGSATIAAAYAGDPSFLPSSGSTARQDPVIVATITVPGSPGGAAPNAAGWYDVRPTVRFTCTPGSAQLEQPCPSPVLLGEGRDQSVTASITAKDGGVAEVTAAGIDVDLTAPRIVVSGVQDGRRYSANPSEVSCTAVDALSGPGTCEVSLRRLTAPTSPRYVATWRYTAVGHDLAGNRAEATGTFVVTDRAVVGVASRANGITSIVAGRYYLLRTGVGGRTAPRFLYAVPAGWHRAARPGPRGVLMTRVSARHWEIRFHLPATAARSARYWNVGILDRTTGRVFRVTLDVGPR